MRNSLGVVAIAVGSLLTAGLSFAEDAVPYWAYGIPPGPVVAPTPAPPDTSMKHLPGNDLSFTRAQISNGFGPADWYPLVRRGTSRDGQTVTFALTMDRLGSKTPIPGASLRFTLVSGAAAIDKTISLDQP